MKSKEVIFEKYEIKKVKVTDSKINIPQEPYFFQTNNSQTIIGLFPQFMDWDGGDGSVWELRVVKIGRTDILKTIIRVNPHSLSDMFSKSGLKNLSQTDHLKLEVLEQLTRYYNEDRVSLEDFNRKVSFFFEDIKSLYK